MRASTHLQRHYDDKDAVESPVFAFATGQLEQLEGGIIDALDAGAERVVLDLDSLASLDSGGVRDLISLLRRTRERGGDVALRATRPAVLRTLRVTALDRLFTMVNTEAA